MQRRLKRRACRAKGPRLVYGQTGGPQRVGGGFLLSLGGFSIISVFYTVFYRILRILRRILTYSDSVPEYGEYDTEYERIRDKSRILYSIRMNTKNTNEYHRIRHKYEENTRIFRIRWNTS